MYNTILLIVDVQTALVKGNPYNIENTLANIKKLADACREKSIEVVYIQHDELSGDFKPNTEGWEIYKDIYPMPGEKIIRKTFNSAFKNTELEDYLNSKNIHTLIITGMQTEYCLDTTIRVAFEKGYRLIVPEETNTTFDNDLLTGKEIYNHHNFKIFKDRFAEVKKLEDVIADISV